VEASDEIFLFVGGASDVEVGVGETGFAKAGAHGFGGSGYIADGVCGVDFDELLEDFAGDGIYGNVILGA
jgi:hypothetical protein